ncbi:hypothetical protein HK28_11820 [Acetobacter sp. DsW_063]|nr:hypothetical protein HK28_11820 [Acetobacter sp. DsW_063]
MPEMLRMARDITTTRSESLIWGIVDLHHCNLNDQPHVIAEIAEIDGIPDGRGFAWDESTLRAELFAIEDKRELARAALFFGDLGVSLMYAGAAH